MFSVLPYKTYPMSLKRAIVENAALNMNILPHPDGVSRSLSPHVLVTGFQPTFQAHGRVAIGTYCQIHDHPNVTNTETSRTTGGIALGPGHDRGGSYHFLSLRTGKKILRSHWTELPTTGRSHCVRFHISSERTFPQHVRISSRPKMISSVEEARLLNTMQKACPLYYKTHELTVPTMKQC